MAYKRYLIGPDFLTFTSNPERDAYYLGLFYADGYNNQKRGTLVLSLQEEDKYILEQLAASIYLEPRPIYSTRYTTITGKKRTVSTLCIGSRLLSEKMAALGAPQAKTFLLKWPTFLNPELETHFIRGYFDGDGSCIESLRSGAKTKTRAIHFPGTEDFLRGLKDAIKRNVGLESGIIPFGNIHLLYLGGNRKSIRFLEWIYENASYYLKRKKQRYIELRTDLDKLDDAKTYVMYDKRKETWFGRLPLKYGRKCTGHSKSREEATTKWRLVMDQIQQTSFEEWLANRPPQRTRGPTRLHVKEQGIADGRYLRKNKRVV